MKIASILMVLLLAGCSTTVPVTRTFPVVPAALQQKCPQLNKLADNAKLSDVAKSVSSNYSLYYECAVKLDSWIEWYTTQKEIFNSIK